MIKRQLPVIIALIIAICLILLGIGYIFVKQTGFNPFQKKAVYKEYEVDYQAGKFVPDQKQFTFTGQPIFIKFVNNADVPITLIPTKESIQAHIGTIMPHQQTVMMFQMNGTFSYTEASSSAPFKLILQ